MEEMLQVIGSNIRYYRKKRGLTQERLGELADFHRTYVGRVERGQENVSVGKLYQIADALGIEPFILLIPRSDVRAISSLVEHVA